MDSEGVRSSLPEGGERSGKGAALSAHKRGEARLEAESRRAWVVVWAAFVAMMVIFGVAYSFAAFFRSFAT
jgi:hypothetical protein